MVKNEQVRVLLVGNGGREHAIAWKLDQSSNVSRIFCVPGNGGTATLSSKVENVKNVSAEDFQSLLQFAVDQRVNLLVPGPEAPLVNGIVDYFKEHGPARIACFGPSRNAARMEGSKVFAKDFMRRCNIPTADYETFGSFVEAEQFLERRQDRRWVIKADGLAAGKGVMIPESHEEAVAALQTIMQAREFGAAGDHVVIEEFLEGEEISILSFSDGYTVRSLPAAQDHKRALDDDKGRNTGGMGAYAPASIATPEILVEIENTILKPTIDHMRNEGFPMVGCLFTGFVLTRDGPKVLEYNVRFGDPEVQTLLPLLKDDLAEIMLACTDGTLSSIDLRLDSRFSTCIVTAAGGYPGNYATGTEIKIESVAEDTHLFHAGTILDASSTMRTSGGRVIASTALGSSVRDAVDKAYTGVKSIQFERMHYRRDIAQRELKRRKSDRQASTDAGLTYSAAGVSIDSGNELVQRIKQFANIGGFGGVYSLSEAGFGQNAPDIVSSIDGIGTKIFIAQSMNDYSTIGIDLVAMNVNDLIVQGAKPLKFLDYYACSKLNVDDAASFVKGVANGCKEADCVLAGGETAEMPGLYHGKDFDAAGCAIGALSKDWTLLPNTAAMQAGDVLLGLASTGVHSNGFSLIRKIVERSGLRYSDPVPWNDPESRSLGQVLLTPTRIYVKSVLSVLRSDVGSAVKGLAHITGGGLVENIPRMLPSHLTARLTTSSWEFPEVYRWLKRTGSVSDHEMLRTLNCGIGMVCAVDEQRVHDVLERIREVDADMQVFQIGTLGDKGSTDISCSVNGLLK